MSNYNINDTIVALSTPMAKSALGVIRMSGAHALSIASKICFSVATDKPIIKFEHRKSYFVNIKDKDLSIVDELVILVTKAPSTFTTEDIVEFYPHGSLIVIERLISLILSYGARLANRGEFTYRAYANGKISISEAEAIHDLIESDNRLMAEASIYKMKGRLSREIDNLKNIVKDILILVEGDIDFPDDDTVPFSYSILINHLRSLKSDIIKLLDNSKTVQKMMSGVKIAILGKTNVGKSSLFNMLISKDRAIVSSIAGTTRDFIHEVFYINSIAFYLIDTAGFHFESTNEIEIEGIRRTKECADEADIIFALFDRTREVDYDDKYLIDFLSNLENKKIAYILNKQDENQVIDSSIFENIIEVSTKTEYGKESILSFLENIFTESDFDTFNKESYVNARERGYLEESLHIIDECIRQSEDSYMLDSIAEEIRILNNMLFSMNGKIEANEVIDEIFANFCIGK